MNKQYVITDPCYILSEEVWQKACKEEFNDAEDQYERFNNRITAELNTLAGTTDAVATDTGFGDWSNCMHCSNDDKIVQSDFFADSGIVCVVEYNDKIKAALEANDNNHLVDEDVGGAALINTEGNVKITMNHDDPSWTVVEIEDEKDGFNSLVAEDDAFDDDDEDEDDEWEDDEEIDDTDKQTAERWPNGDDE